MKKTTRITSAEVAEYAGVSQSAVSRVFTPGASVSKKMRTKVEDAAKLLGYRPNAIARSLITSQSKIIAVVVAYLDNLFYPSLLEELSKQLSSKNYHLLLFTGMKEKESDEVFEQLMQYQVDGIILTSTALSSVLSAECANAGIPVVLINRTNDSQIVSSITSDNYHGGYQVADLFLASGCKKFAYVSGVENSSTNRDRFNGFRDRLLKASISDIEIIEGAYSREIAEESTRTLLKTKILPDAIFSANDHMAFGVMDVIRFEFGLKIPNDISIIGYDNVAQSSWPSYSLTTVEQPVKEMVSATLETLFRQIDSEMISVQHIKISGNLIKRNSTK